MLGITIIILLLLELITRRRLPARVTAPSWSEPRRYRVHYVTNNLAGAGGVEPPSSRVTAEHTNRFMLRANTKLF